VGSVDNFHGGSHVYVCEREEYNSKCVEIVVFYDRISSSYKMLKGNLSPENKVDMHWKY